MTFISIICGGGIVAVPYAYTSAGFEFGLVCQLFVMLAMLFSASLYLEAYQRLGCESTFTAVAQQCIGNYSSLLVNGIIAFCILGVLTIYFILFSTILLSLFAGQNIGSWWDKKSTYVILLSVVMLSQLANKNMHEIKCVTYLLFIGVMSMLALI